MSIARNGDVELYYETRGEPEATPLLLVMGLGGQLIAWDEDFLTALVDAGFFVIVYDNRDVGKSTWFDAAGPIDLMPFLTGGTVTAPYLLQDLAADGVAVLDALDLASAHVLGISMGGMIAQQLTIDFPDRVRTLTSIMSTTGDLAVGQPTPEAVATLLVPAATTRDEAIDQSVEGWRVISSPGYPFEEAEIRQRAAEAYDRAFHPDGTGRQLGAILASPDRTAALGRLDLPALVIHGTGDVLVTPSGGEATAKAIPGAKFITYPGMGHDLPRPLWPELIAEVVAVAARA